MKNVAVFAAVFAISIMLDQASAQVAKPIVHELNQVAGQVIKPITHEPDQASSQVVKPITEVINTGIGNNDFHITIGGHSYDLSAIASSGVLNATTGRYIQKLHKIKDINDNYFIFTLPIAGEKPSPTSSDYPSGFSWNTDLVQCNFNSGYYGYDGSYDFHSIGTYNSSSWTLSDNGTFSVKFTGGAYCDPIDADRSATVTFRCAATNSSSSDEPDTCYYKIDIAGPEVCALSIVGTGPTVTPSKSPSASTSSAVLTSSFGLVVYDASAASFGATEKAAFCATAATITGACSTCCKVDGVQDTLRRRLSVETQKTPKVKVSFSIVTPLPAGAYATTAFNVLKNVLTTALTSDTFGNTLRTTASTMGATGLITASATSSGLTDTGFVQSAATAQPAVGNSKGKGKHKETNTKKTKTPKIVTTKAPGGLGTKGKSKEDRPKPAKKEPTQTHTKTPKAPTVAKKGGSKRGGSK